MVSAGETGHVLAARNNRVLPENVYLSNTSAAKLLGIGGYAVRHGVRAGLLTAHTHGRQTDIPLVELVLFHQTYLMASEGACVLGINPKEFTWKMKQYGLRPRAMLHTHPTWKRDIAENLFERIRIWEHRLAESGSSKQGMSGVGANEIGVEAAVSLMQ